MTGFLVVLVSSAPRADATPAGDNGLIVFNNVCDDGCQGGFEIMTPDGAGRMSVGEGWNPRWSPDGTRIAFGYAEDIWIMRADGTQSMNLTTEMESLGHPQPVWSPDGNKIAFARNTGGSYDVWTMNANSTGLTHVTMTPGINEALTDWSATGRMLYLDDGQLWTMSADGTDRESVGDANLEHPPLYARFSPDGEHIVFTRDGDIWSIDADGTNETKLTDQELDGYSDVLSPTWSPDGTRIAFSAALVEGTSQVWSIQTMDVDGSNRSELATDVDQLTSLDWQRVPDGRAHFASITVRGGPDYTHLLPFIHLCEGDFGTGSGRVYLFAGRSGIGGSVHDPDPEATCTLTVNSADVEALGGTVLSRTCVSAGDASCLAASQVEYGTTGGVGLINVVVELPPPTPPYVLPVGDAEITFDCLIDHPQTFRFELTDLAPFETSHAWMFFDETSPVAEFGAVGDSHVHDYPAADGTVYQQNANATNGDDPMNLTVPIQPGVLGCSLEESFSDVPIRHTFWLDIEWAAAEGVADGFPDGTYRPGSAITRQAMSAFLYRIAGEPSFTPPISPTFPDVPVTHTFFVEIEWMVAEGIAGGFPDGRFHPNDAITRQAMAAFLYRLASEPPFTPPTTPTFPDVASSHPFYGEIEWLASTEVTGGFADGTYRPNSAVTRQAMAAFLHRYDGL